MGRTRNGGRGRGAGFSLVELMVVITIIGILASLVGVNVYRALVQANVTQARSQMIELEKAIDQFRMEKHRLPDSLEELVEGEPEERYLAQDEVPRDPWDHDYVYTKVDRRTYDLVSLGEDGVEGGEGEAADITRKDLRKRGPDRDEE